MGNVWICFYNYLHFWGSIKEAVTKFGLVAFDINISWFPLQNMKNEEMSTIVVMDLVGVFLWSLLWKCNLILFQHPTHPWLPSRLKLASHSWITNSSSTSSVLPTGMDRLPALVVTKGTRWHQGAANPLWESLAAQHCPHQQVSMSPAPTATCSNAAFKINAL